MNKKIKKLQELLKQKELEAAVIVSRPNTVYLSGFLGSSSLIIITESESFFATDFRYLEHVTELCGDDYKIESGAGLDNYLEEKVKELGIKNIGFEDGGVSFARYSLWADKLPTVNFTGIQTDIEKIRQIKDSDELEIIQKAVEIADGAFSYILKFLKAGVRELDIAAEIEYYMKKNGATAPSFETISISGTRTSMPHGKPTDKIIETGDAVTMDFGALYNGYCSDMTRTVFVGNPEQKLKDIYKTVLKAQLESQKNAFAGKTGMEIDAISRDIIYGAGYEGYYGHGLGHSVGIEVHESPRFNTKDTTVMEDGMVMTVEPGIYIPDLGGVRIENMIVINGYEPINMTHSTKELIIL